VNHIDRRLKEIAGDFDPEQKPPRIEPVPAGTPRPHWSVMIPTFNCAKYLEKTLQSVLSQDPGINKMQIQVVDDCSTQDDPEEVTQRIGKGRVLFSRNSQNSGSCSKNFNICIEKSIGKLIHILHGDDFVLPGFYEKIHDLEKNNPETSFFSTRCFFVDEQGTLNSVSARVKSLEKSSKNNEEFLYTTAVQSSGVVIRRSFYEKNGGFLTNLVHTADNELYARAIAMSSGIVSKEVMATYRVFSANDTSKLVKTGKNIIDIYRLNKIFSKKYPSFSKKKGLERAVLLALSQTLHFKKEKDRESYIKNKVIYHLIAPLGFRFKQKIKQILNSVKTFLNV